MNEPAAPVLEAVKRLADSTRADHLRKMRGLYVDYSGGAVLLPEEITVAEARELAANVQAILDVAEQAWCRDEVRERLREVREQHFDVFANFMASTSQAVETDPDTA